MKTFQDVQEGVYDPNIFKAIFLAGGPGSGKSYVVRKTTGGLGMKIVNSDDIYEKMLKDAGMEATPEDIFSDKGQEIRVKAKKTTKVKQGGFLNGRLGIIIDGTGKDYSKIASQMQSLKGLGYDCSMIFVNTSLDTAQERNKMRKRTLPEKQVALFGSKDFIIVDNNDPAEDVFLKVWKRISKIVKAKVTNTIAKRWVEQELSKKKR